MGNTFFQFKQFTIHQEHCAMKVCTDACIFGAWCAMELSEVSGHCLDIGTGTGLLSLMIAQKTRLHFDAVEIDAAAAKQAKLNFAASPFHERVTIVEEDILAVEGQYDAVVSNPPFYERELKSDKHTKNIAHHSEALTLISLVDKIKEVLKADCFFFLLLPYKRKKEVEELFVKKKIYIQQLIELKQSVHHQPFRFMIKASFNKQSQHVSELSIVDENGQYTREAAYLLKDYYKFIV